MILRLSAPGRVRPFEGYRRVALILALVATLAGCAATTKEAKVGKRAAAHQVDDLPGLRELLGRSAEDEGMLRLLTVYGVAYPEPGYSGALMNALTEALNLSPRGTRRHGQLIRSVKGNPRAVGALWIHDYANEAKQHRLRHYELSAYRTSDVQAPVALDPQSTDVSWQIDEYRRALRYPFQQALCWVLTDRVSGSTECDVNLEPAKTLDRDQVAVVAESFGSGLIFDMLDGVDADELSTEVSLDPFASLESLEGEHHRVASKVPLVTISHARHGYLFSVGDPRGSPINYDDNRKLIQVLSCGSELPCD